MRKMNENTTIAGIRNELCIKLLRVYLVYLKRRQKWKEVWRCSAANIENR